MNWKDNYVKWKKNDLLQEDLKKELNIMEKTPLELEDAFYKPLEFGTAGMRGLLGPGINRMNIYTVRQATQGLANFMDSLDENIKKRGVAISYDSRLYSKKFAFDAAKVLGFHNIPSFIFESLRPTPELSFTIRYLHTYAGIMITASHNPKQYNGYKIYGEDGAQMPPKESKLITKYIRKISNIFSINISNKEELIENGMLNIIGDEIDEEYLSKINSIILDHNLINDESKSMSLVFTPLNGTGAIIGEKALKRAGFKKFMMVPQQSLPDPNFSTVSKPNPEDPASFNLAIRLGKKVNADILIGVDPDADRLGVAVKQYDGKYKLLTGNQIAAIMLDYILMKHKINSSLPSNSVMVKSIVSTELATKIASNYGVKTINVLTGFKFIAEKIKEFETKNNHTFMFGFEESYGYLIKPFVRDKDAIQSLIMISEVAAYYKKHGMTLYDGLEKLFKKYGYYAEKTVSLTFNGVDGTKKIDDLMTKFRQESPVSFANHKIVFMEDYKNSVKLDSNGNFVQNINLPKSNVIKYILDDETWIAIRPSGTEPKIKFYVGVRDNSEILVMEKRQEFIDSIMSFVRG